MSIRLQLKKGDIVECITNNYNRITHDKGKRYKILGISDVNSMKYEIECNNGRKLNWFVGRHEYKKVNTITAYPKWF